MNELSTSMNAIVYRNTKTTLPNWVNNVHLNQPRGLAYEQDGYFVHIYGKEQGLWVISLGLTASQEVRGTLQDWVINVFGAKNIETLNLPIGEVISGVWRPGLYYQTEIFQALEITEFEQRAAEQALRILVDKLDDLLLYIEPSLDGLKAYSHKTREFLILACTEVENIWKQYMKIAGVSPIGSNFSTIDYVKLDNALYLSEYEIALKIYNNIAPIRPFYGWSSARPTQSLLWYDAYNKTKHDRSKHFGEATLNNCIYAIAANIVLFCVRFSPYPLFHGASTLSALINQLFDIRLVGVDPKTFYAPKIQLPNTYSKGLVCGQVKDFVLPWIAKPLIL